MDGDDRASKIKRKEVEKSSNNSAMRAIYQPFLIQWFFLTFAFVLTGSTVTVSLAHDADSTGRTMRDGKYHIAVPRQRGKPDSDPRHHNRQSNNTNNPKNHPDVKSISTKRDGNNLRENGGGNDLTEFRNYEYQQGSSNSRSNSEERKKYASRHENSIEHPIHDPTGDGNTDYNSKQDKANPISSREEEDQNKMIVVYCSVAFFVFVAFNQLRA